LNEFWKGRINSIKNKTTKKIKHGSFPLRGLNKTFCFYHTDCIIWHDWANRHFQDGSYFVIRGKAWNQFYYCINRNPKLTQTPDLTIKVDFGSHLHGITFRGPETAENLSNLQSDPIRSANVESIYNRVWAVFFFSFLF
jgi:hypothetical protein